MSQALVDLFGKGGGVEQTPKKTNIWRKGPFCELINGPHKVKKCLQYGEKDSPHGFFLVSER